MCSICLFVLGKNFDIRSYLDNNCQNPVTGTYWDILSIHPIDTSYRFGPNKSDRFNLDRMDVETNDCGVVNYRFSAIGLKGETPLKGKAFEATLSKFPLSKFPHNYSNN